MVIPFPCTSTSSSPGGRSERSRGPPTACGCFAEAGCRSGATEPLIVSVPRLPLATRDIGILREQIEVAKVAPASAVDRGIGGAILGPKQVVSVHPAHYSGPRSPLQDVVGWASLQHVIPPSAVERAREPARVDHPVGSIGGGDQCRKRRGDPRGGAVGGVGAASGASGSGVDD